MKRGIILFLFFINFIPIYVNRERGIDIGIQVFAGDFDEIGDMDEGLYNFGNFLAYDQDGDGFIDGILYYDSDGALTYVIIERSENHEPNDDWNISNESLQDTFNDFKTEEYPDTNPEDPYNPTYPDNDEEISYRQDDPSSFGHPSVSETKLKYEVKKAVAHVIELYGIHEAHCNLGVQTTFKGIFGTNELDNMCANDMVTHWRNTPANWQPITNMSEAQELANKGYFVVAGYQAPVGSGHVVVVMPGEMRYSGYWECMVPNTMDTGANRRSEFQKFSNSFGSNKKGHVEFYYYK